MGVPPTVLVVSYRAAGLLDACLESVATWLPDAPVLVWDNASDGTPAVRELATRWPAVDWHFSPANIGFAAAVNRLAERAGPGNLLLLNPDARLLCDLAATRACVEDEAGIAAAAPFVRDSRGRLWDNAHREPGLVRQIASYSGYAGRFRRPWLSDVYDQPPDGPVGYLTGSCLLINRAAWDAVGSFDERYFLYSEEADWALRARRAGWTLRLVHELGAEHDAGGTVVDSPVRSLASRRLLRESQLRYLADHHGRGSARVFAGATAVLGRVQRSKRRSRRAAAGRRPHVVITSNTLGVGGAERQRVLLANGLARRGYPVTLALLQGAGPLRGEVSDDVAIVHTPWRVPRPDVEGPAVVITGTTNTEAAYGTIWRHASVGLGTRRWVVAAHTPPQPDRPTYPPALARLIRASDGVIALSHSHWHQLTARQRLHDRPPWVVANGVPAPKLRIAQPSLPQEDGVVRIVFLGRLVEHKGVQVAIDALARLADRRWTFDVYGDGPFRAQLEAAVPVELADRIRLHGAVTDTTAVLRHADLLVLPSRLEAMPLSLLEAMWAGTAVMANPVGAVHELLDGGAGILPAGPDAASWAHALRDVLDDPDLLAQIGRAGHDRVVSAYRLDAMLDGYERVLADVMSPPDEGRLRVTHVGNSPQDRGGIASVIRTYSGRDFDDVDTRTIATYDSSSRIRTVARFGAALAGIAFGRRARLGVVHVHLSMRGSFLREGAVVVIASARRVPVVATVHGSSFVPWSAGHPRLTRAVLGRADRVTVLSAPVADHLRALGVGNVVRIPNAVAPPAQVSAPSGTPVAVFAGELSRRKGVDVLLAAWPDVARTNPAALLRLIGPIVDVTPPADAAGVEYLGELPNDDVLAQLAQAWVAVLPSRFEGMPMFLLEAMAAGCGIVATPVGGIPDLVPGRTSGVGIGTTGELVTVGDVTALADAIARALESETATARAQAARELIADRFDAGALGERMRDVWREAVRRS